VDLRGNALHLIFKTMPAVADDSTPKKGYAIRFFAEIERRLVG
jgi:hypothetical protein